VAKGSRYERSPLLDTVQVVENMQAGFRDTLFEVQRRSEVAAAQTAQQVAELQGAFNQSMARETAKEDLEDKFQAISTLEIKRHLP
jgi:hypothetical protein